MAAPSPQDIQEAYLNNADWFATSSVAKAKSFATACAQMLALAKRTSKRGQGSGAEHEFDYQFIKQELDSVRSWLIDNDDTIGGAPITDVDFSEADCRGLDISNRYD